MKINEADLERLMSLVDQRGGWRGHCWFWDGPRNVKYHPVWEVDGVHHSPEHILYQRLCGIPVDEAEPIKSKCHVVGCINPTHKVGGARADAAKLDGEKVQQIRASNDSSKSLAETYGVSRQTICDIWRGRCWVDVPGRRETARARTHRRNKVVKPKRIRVGVTGIKFDPDTGKYIASYYKKHIGESDSLEGAVALRNTWRSHESQDF